MYDVLEDTDCLREDRATVCDVQTIDMRRPLIPSLGLSYPDPVRPADLAQL